MRTKFLTSLGLSGLLLAGSFLPALAQVQTYSSNYQQTVTQQSQSFTLPAGTGLAIRETGMMSANVGDRFNGQLVTPIIANGRTVIPSGSMVSGEIVAFDPAARTRAIQIHNITTPTGNMISFESHIVAALPSASSAVREDPLTGQVQTSGGNTTLFPHVSWGPDNSPASRIIGSTLGGATLGAATGTLTGLTMHATSRSMYRHMKTGTAVARGLGWGAAYGAGFGLLGGIISAATDRQPVAVTSTRSTAALPPDTTMHVVLDQPVTFTL